jgi:DNA-binding TFAR19-related protein (PDSD5 family)
MLRNLHSRKRRNLQNKMDDEEIRRHKLEELRQRYQQNMEGSAQEAEMHQRIQQIEIIIKQKMTKEALQRYSNIKAADPEKSVQVIAVIAQIIQRNNNETIDDEKLKRILTLINLQKRETKITRK